MRTRKNTILLIAMMLLVSLLLVACGQEKKSEAPEAPANPMQYIKVGDLKTDMEGDGKYLILDVRKDEDFQKSHLKGSFGSDMDKANKEGDKEDGIAKMKATLKEATGSETGKDDTKVVLVCYSGKTYAQAATDALAAIGFNKDNVYTLEGGMKEWEAGGEEYKALME